MFRALGNRNYRIWAGGALVSNIGDLDAEGGAGLAGADGVDRSFRHRRRHHDGLQFLPMLLLGPYAGVLADRYRKLRDPEVDADGHGPVRTLVGLLVLTGSAQLWQVYVAALCLGAGQRH